MPRGRRRSRHRVLGHAPFVVVVKPNVPVKPFTLFVNKSAIDTEKNELHARLTWGAAQAGVAAGVIAAMGKAAVWEVDTESLLLIAAVWVDPKADDEETVYANNEAATIAALAPAAPARRRSPTCSPRANRRTRSSAHEHHAGAGGARDRATPS